MSRDVDKLLQECLAGLDAGLTAEECLSAWPRQRDQLEPMLRQAVMLRMAFAHAPAEEYRENARERLMFAAGREASQALAAEPDSRFVQRLRHHLLSAAGASAQESLRSVAPPRLAFWVNARRRLLDAAATHSLPARPSPAMGLAFRSAMSAAVVVLAIAVAGMAYFSAQPAKASVDARLAAIDQQLREIEQQQDAGNQVSAAKIVDLSTSYTATVEKLSAESPASITKANELIPRLKEAANASDPSTSQQVTQQLNQVEDKVRLLAAGASAPLPPAATPAAPTAVAGSGANPTAAPAATSPTASPATPVPQPLGANQARLTLLPSDNALGLNWSELRTERFRIVLPSNWTVIGANFDATGLAKVETKFIPLLAPDGTTVTINIQNGEVQAIANGSLLALRDEDGDRMNVTDLVAKGGELASVFDHMLESIVHVPLTPTPSPTSTATPPSPTAAPARTSTATP